MPFALETSCPGLWIRSVALTLPEKNKFTVRDAINSFCLFSPNLKKAAINKKKLKNHFFEAYYKAR